MSEKVRTIWILFGDMSGFESDIDKLKNAYRIHSSVVNTNGYTLGIPSYLQTKETFTRLITDNSSVGMIWHSHGAFSPHFGPRGSIVDREKSEIKPTDLTSLKLTLQFAALFGCSIAKDSSTYDAWKKAFGLERRKGAYGSIESRMIADTEKSWFWGKRYGNVEPPAQKFAQYQFPRWIKNL